MTQAPSIKEAFVQYRRTQIAEMTPWVEGFDMRYVSVSATDASRGSPKTGDMIARNPKNHADQWLVAAQYFADNFEPLATLPPSGERREAIARIIEARASVYDGCNAVYRGSTVARELRNILDTLLASLASGLVQDEAGWVATWMIQNGYVTGHGDTLSDLLGNLVAAVRVDEREKCAKIADRIAEDHEDGRDACMSEGPPNTKGALTQARQAQTAASIAAAIRSARDGGAS